MLTVGMNHISEHLNEYPLKTTKTGLMVIKDIALWLLENTELLSRSKHGNRILQQLTLKTQNNIILLWYEFKL